MFTKAKLAIALTASLLAGTVGFAAANGDFSGSGTKPDSAERAQMRADRKAKMLAQFDVNHDGKLDKTERKAMRTAMAEKRFGKLDTNGDGVISKDEFLAGAQKGHHHKHGKLNKGGQGQVAPSGNGQSQP